MHRLFLLLLVPLLIACNTDLPESGVVEKKMPLSDEQVASGATTTAATDTAADGDATAADETATDGEAEAVAAEAVAALVKADNPGISDTQDFSATSGRLTIEDDKALLKAQRQNFKLIKPEALPKRAGESVNVTQFALQTKHNVGDKVYKRFNPLGAAVAKRNCKRYRLPDDAQEAFLKAGGPERDPKSLDPDGDGFACDWTPDTYRKLLQ